MDAEIAEIEAKLRKPSFVEKAPAAVVEKKRQRLRELQEKRAALGGAARDLLRRRAGSTRTTGGSSRTASASTRSRPPTRLARELIELYFDEGQDFRTTVLVAEAQPGAYGRNERRWEAPAGQGLYLTLVRRAEAGEPLSVVPIAVARWAREVLVAETGAAIALKWPNDLYVGQRKLGGVIAESRTQGEETYVAIGIGINVKGEPSALGVANATTLEEETGKTLALAPLLQALLDRFDRELAAPRWGEEVRAWELVAATGPATG